MNGFSYVFECATCKRGKYSTSLFSEKYFKCKYECITLVLQGAKLKYECISGFFSKCSM